MPIIVPPFVPYQAPLIALRGLWNHKPVEGDKFIPVEIDWGAQAGPGQAVQFALSSFSPVEFSQIVALSVDNGRSGADVDFLFPDTGKQLTVPAYCQGIFPIVTNSLTFYVVGTGAVQGDVTVFEILNSMVPPVTVVPSTLQSHAGITGFTLAANGTVVVVPAPTYGTVVNLSITISGASTTTGACVLSLQDGTTAQLWTSVIEIPVGAYATTISVPGLRLRFRNGLSAVITGSSGITAAACNINVYYSVP